MCGILAVHGLQKPSNDRAHFISLSKRLRHRGPDWSGCYVGRDCVLVHERLAIVGIGGLVLYFLFLSCSTFIDTGAQPLTSQDGKISLTVNGEIYNHVALRAKVGPDVTFKTHSDCEVIIPLVCVLPPVHLGIQLICI
jgi:asparagine synthase (glutamine-hydrolysing)